VPKLGRLRVGGVHGPPVGQGVRREGPVPKGVMLYDPPPIMAAYDWARGLALGLGWLLGCGARLGRCVKGECEI